MRDDANTVPVGVTTFSPRAYVLPGAAGQTEPAMATPPLTSIEPPPPGAAHVDYEASAAAGARTWPRIARHERQVQSVAWLMGNLPVHAIARTRPSFLSFLVLLVPLGQLVLVWIVLLASANASDDSVRY
jgi:hypothetical protein